MNLHSKAQFFALIVVITMSITILFMISQFSIPIFLAVISAYIIYPIFEKYSTKFKKPKLTALTIILLTVLLCIIPLIFIGGSLYSQLQSFDINIEEVTSIETSIQERFGIEISFADSIEGVKEFFITNAREYSQYLVSFTSSFIVGLFLYLLLVYYILLEKNTILKFIRDILPFSTSNSQNIILQSGLIVKALVIGQVGTAIIQGVLGMISFMIAGISGAIFWGFIMIILSLIPIVGAFLVWFPAGLFLLYQGNIVMGVFVLLWGAIVVSQIDNLVRPILVNRYYDVHPMFIILGVFAGIGVFGLLGIIIGPLLFVLFILFYTTYKKEYMAKIISSKKN